MHAGRSHELRTFCGLCAPLQQSCHPFTIPKLFVYPPACMETVFKTKTSFLEKLLALARPQLDKAPKTVM